ncbi:hypothetical protein chiPu_0017123 [Chiloscyllium punctatum]|uniref:Uncharacterized protein n=1 Tax=Chiloscyllium punctatum TaxID=137246 RepID=A0A401T7J6_CHIPU|nr:hypothetical protein [Chiloscyllium punctatum]
MTSASRLRACAAPLAGRRARSSDPVPRRLAVNRRLGGHGKTTPLRPRILRKSLTETYRALGTTEPTLLLSDVAACLSNRLRPPHDPGRRYPWKMTSISSSEGNKDKG